MPLRFEANEGQTDPQVDYLARAPGYTLFLTPTEAVLSLGSVQAVAAPPGTNHLERPPARSCRTAVVRMQLLGGNKAAHAAGDDRLPGRVNYFKGKDSSQWQTGIATYAKVQYQDVYAGIDLLYYGNQNQLEYDFHLVPGADPSKIRVGFVGAQSVRVDNAGQLVIQMGGQELRQHKPVAYQEVLGQRREVTAAFVVQNHELSFKVGDYDRSQPLVIDPTLNYSTYLGGSQSDGGNGIAVDAAGNVYVTGFTSSPDFPTANAFQPQPAGTQQPFGYSQNAFVAKLSADGSGLVYSTFLGGSGDPDGNGDAGQAITVDEAGNAYVTGFTVSGDFPTVNAVQPVLGGSHTNAFVAKLSSDGSTLAYSTYLGGSGDDWGNGIAVDTAGNAYIVGFTNSQNFPAANALQPVYGALPGFGTAFVAKISP